MDLLEAVALELHPEVSASTLLKERAKLGQQRKARPKRRTMALMTPNLGQGAHPIAKQEITMSQRIALERLSSLSSNSYRCRSAQKTNHKETSL
jgi:hypothetical protein